MKQYGIAIEWWDLKRRREVFSWLTQNYGDPGSNEGEKRWNIIYDYDLHTLTFDEDVYTMYLLRFS